MTGCEIQVMAISFFFSLWSYACIADKGKEEDD